MGVQSGCNTSVQYARSVVARAGLPKSRSGIKRKELQKSAQLEYMRTFYEVILCYGSACAGPLHRTRLGSPSLRVRLLCALRRTARTTLHPLPRPDADQAAERIDGDDVLVRLDDARPRAAAARRDEARAAELSRRLGARIQDAATWGELVDVLRNHGADLNYINVAALAARAGELAPGAAEPPHPRAQAASRHPEQRGVPQQPPPEVDRIGALALDLSLIHISEPTRQP